MAKSKRLSAGAKLRNLMSEQSWVALQGCHDPLSARLAQRAGFEAAELGGFAVEASLVGAPDIGIMTLTELASHAARVCAAVDIPVVADVDTGFGGVNNVARTVREMERAGLAGLHIEDQTLPKRCPVLEGRAVVPLDQALGRLGAALDARNDDDFFIIARCDADVVSFSELIRRCQAYLKAGADLVLPMTMIVDGQRIHHMSPHDHMELYARMVKEIGGPVMTVLIPDGYTAQDVADLGFRFISTPALGLEAAANAMLRAFTEARKDGTASAYFKANPNIMNAGLEIMEMLGLENYLSVETRFDPTAPGAIAELAKAE